MRKMLFVTPLMRSSYEPRTPGRCLWPPARPKRHRRIPSIAPQPPPLSSSPLTRTPANGSATPLRFLAQFWKHLTEQRYIYTTPTPQSNANATEKNTRASHFCANFERKRTPFCRRPRNIFHNTVWTNLLDNCECTRIVENKYTLYNGSLSDKYWWLEMQYFGLIVNAKTGTRPKIQIYFGGRYTCTVKREAAT